MTGDSILAKHVTTEKLGLSTRFNNAFIVDRDTAEYGPDCWKELTDFFKDNQLDEAAHENAQRQSGQLLR
jgi:hypothetical protein